jgi:hypothetical protein
MQPTSDFLTLETLATWGGLTMAVYMIVAVTKQIIKDKWPDWGVRVLAFSWAFIIQLFVAGGTGKLLWPWAPINAIVLGLAFLNAFGVVLSTAGLHEVITDPKAEKVKPAPIMELVSGATETRPPVQVGAPSERPSGVPPD